MINSAKCNMYEFNAKRTCEIYADHIQATGNETVLALSEYQLSSQAVDALEKSLHALGYAAQSLGFVITKNLGSADLISIVEGLDPLCLIVTDKFSTDLLSSAYHCDVNLDDTARILGRTVIVFFSFENMLIGATEKQQAWNLLKKLPRFN